MKYFLYLLMLMIYFGAGVTKIKADLTIDIEETMDSEIQNNTADINNEVPDYQNDNAADQSSDMDNSDDMRVRNLKEMDISALTDFCTSEGVCRNLTYDDPTEIAFFTYKPKVRFTSDTTYVLKSGPQYEILQFLDSKFVNFPLNLFYTLKIKELDMRECDMEYLSWDNFLMANDLTILLLSRNRLTQIMPQTFEKAEQLSFLFLDSNQINSLYSQSFEGLSKLYLLDLHDNQLDTLPPGVFSYLPALQQLNLAGNRLTILTDGTFNNNIRLTSFNIANNMLTTLDEYIFQNQDYMDYIDFSNNPDLETLVGNMRVDNLWARNCSLTRINVYGKAKNVDFQHNQIKELYFSQPEFLETLRLKDNTLEQLASLTMATNLMVFDISHNPQLKSLPDLSEADSLERLDLSNISLCSIPLTIIEGPERLKFLNVSYNRLTHIEPSDFQYYEKLQQLYIHNNNWNCYSLQLFMDMVIKPNRISYTLDNYDESFPGEYIGGIKCMYRLQEIDEEEDIDLGFSQKDELNLSGLAEQLNEAPSNSDTNENVSEVNELRKEVKAIVGIYEQKFGIILNKLERLDERLKQFERLNRTMWNQVTITV